MPAPPGTILQHLYVRERLRDVAPGRFVEVGIGRGLLSRVLLDLGWKGVGYDLNDAAVHAATETNSDAVAAGRFEARRADWLREPPGDSVDLVISSMVIEHLDDQDEARYFARAAESLTKRGFAVMLVPSSPRHWGIEDDIAGHLRRYTQAGLRARLEELGWEARHLAGLTYPLSNALLPVSNVLVRRAEREKTDLDATERTRRSGVRDVAYKTMFPRAFGLVLNERALYPLHLAQKAFRNSDRALVLYAEATPRRAESSS